MTGMVDWVRAQVESDKTKAQTASPGPWSPNTEGDEVVAVDGVTVADGFALSGNQLRATVDHIATHDPSDTIARCDAELAILDLYDGTRAIKDKVEALGLKAWELTAGQLDDWTRATGELAVLLLVVEHLASGYRNRPGWKAEWPA